MRAFVIAAAALLCMAGTASALTPAQLLALEKACNVTMPTPPANATAYVGKLRYANITGMDMAYLRFGNAASSQPPLILVPGYGSGMSTWPSTMLKDLASQHEVILIDNRGQGYSNNLEPNATLSIQSMAVDVKNFVQALNLTRPNLGGVSMGGMITLTSAVLHGDVYHRFVVFSGSAGSKHSHRISKETAQIMSGVNVTIEQYMSLYFPIQYPEAFKAACNYIVDTPYRFDDPVNSDASKPQFQAIINYFNSDEVFDKLNTTDHQIYIVGGALDPVITVFNQKLAAKQLPYAWLTVFDHGAHATYVQYWPTISKTMRVFLTADLMSGERD